MKKVYIVTAGCYSDYRIMRIFKDEELANKFVEYHGGISGDCEVEDWKISEAKIIAKPFWAVCINDDGEISYSNCWPDREKPRGFTRSHYDDYGKEVFLWEGFAKGEEHAEKQAKDSWAKYKAGEVGIS